MAYLIIVGILALVFVSAGLVCIEQKDGVGFILLVFGLVLGVSIYFSATKSDSPKNAATNIVYDIGEEKLAVIQDELGADCYVLRDTNGYYYFVIEKEDQFGKGNSSFEAVKLDSSKVIIHELESDVAEGVVQLKEVEAKATAESLGIRPIPSYTFVVPRGTIKFTEKMPE